MAPVQRSKQASSHLPFSPKHVSYSEGVDISSGYQSIHPSSIYSSVSVRPALPAAQLPAALLHWAAVSQSFMHVGGVYFMFPSAPCRPCCCDLEQKEKRETLGGGMPPSFLLLNSATREILARAKKGKMWDTQQTFATEKPKWGHNFKRYSHCPCWNGVHLIVV